MPLKSKWACRTSVGLITAIVFCGHRVQFRWPRGELKLQWMSHWRAWCTRILVWKLLADRMGMYRTVGKLPQSKPHLSMQGPHYTRRCIIMQLANLCQVTRMNDESCVQTDVNAKTVKTWCDRWLCTNRKHSSFAQLLRLAYPVSIMRNSLLLEIGYRICRNVSHFSWTVTKAILVLFAHYLLQLVSSKFDQHVNLI